MISSPQEENLEFLKGHIWSNKLMSWEGEDDGHLGRNPLCGLWVQMYQWRAAMMSESRPVHSEEDYKWIFRHKQAGLSSNGTFWRHDPAMTGPSHILQNISRLVMSAGHWGPLPCTLVTAWAASLRFTFSMPIMLEGNLHHRVRLHHHPGMRWYMPKNTLLGVWLELELK